MKTNTKKLYKKIIYFAFLTAIIFSISKVYAAEINEQSVVKLINESRMTAGLDVIVSDNTLNKVAADKLEDMIKNNYFAHTSPKGLTPWNWYEKEGYDYKFAGENLAINFLTAESQHKAWMASPTHRKNIMNPLFRDVGVAVGAGEINGQMAIITVQEFGTLYSEANEVSDSAPAVPNGKSSQPSSEVKNQLMTPEKYSKPAVKIDKIPAEPVPVSNQGKVLGFDKEILAKNLEKASILFGILAVAIAFAALIIVGSRQLIGNIKNRKASLIHPRYPLMKNGFIFNFTRHMEHLESKNKKHKSIPVKFFDDFTKTAMIKIHML